MNLMTSIEDQGDASLGLKSLFFQKVVQSMYSGARGRSKEIHVSDLVYDCLRRSYLRKMIPLPTMDYRSILRVWIGRQIHLFPFLEKHELSLEWNGIVGRVDDYEDGFLVDKKTTRSIPSRVRSHHKLQLDYYRVLASENGYPVVLAAVLYINVGSDVEIDVKVVKFKRSVEVTKNEMLEKKKRFQVSLDSGELPPRRIGWICKYCDWCNLCFCSDKTIRRMIRNE